MNESLYEAQLYLDKADETLSDAEQILKIGLTLAAVNRIYYSIYYCIHGLLLSKNVFTKTHQGANIKFNEFFIKTEKLPRMMAQWASEALEFRQQADYDIDSDISTENADILLNNARQFYMLSREYLEKLIKENEI